MNRREFGRISGIAATLAAIGSPLAASNLVGSGTGGREAPSEGAPASQQYQIAMLAYNGMTALELVGPQYAFASIMGANVSIVARTLDPVVTDTNLTLVPHLTFEQVPEKLTVLFVPGGSQGTLKAMADPATVAFVQHHGGKATWVTSVCTGSLILGAAGLLEGRKATSHWLVRDTVLPILGATPVNQRVVIDGNRMTGAGVSAGIDFGLELVRRIRDDDYARAVQLMCEYDPHPPFQAGTPELAGPKITAMMTGMHSKFLADTCDAARQAKARWNA